MTPRKSATRQLALGILFALSSMGAETASHTQAVPRSFVASPDIYTVVAENEQFRIIAVTWKPGQRDNWHSHGSPTGVYNVTACTMRSHLPDGKTNEINRKAGDARFGTQPPSHSLENIGKEDCRLIIFETK